MCEINISILKFRQGRLKAAETYNDGGNTLSSELRTLTFSTAEHTVQIVQMCLDQHS